MSEYATYVGKLDEKFWSSPSVDESWQIIDEYFEYIDIDTAQQYLWKLTIGSITNKDINEIISRGEPLDLIYFFEFTKFVLEVLDYLRTSKKRSPEGTRKNTKRS